MSLTQREALRLLIAHRDGLFAYVRTLVSDRHLAEDILQQVSLVVLQRYAQIPDRTAFLPWARKVARLQALHQLRLRRPGRLVFGDAVYDAIDREWAQLDGVRYTEVLDALEVCVGQLPDRSRELLEWRFAHGFDCTEVARRLGQTVASVYTALSRLYDRLGDCIKRRLAAAEGTE